MHKKLSPLEQQALTWRIIAIVLSVLAATAFLSVFATTASIEQNLVDVKTGIIMSIAGFAALIVLSKLANICFDFCHDLQRSIQDSAARRKNREIANCQ